MYLPELTTLDVDGLDPRLPVVIPFAAIEQHGPPSGDKTLKTIHWHREGLPPSQPRGHRP